MCEICGGSGHYRMDVEFGHPQFGKLQRCGCRANEDAQRLQRLSGLTNAERTVRLDQIETTDRPGAAAMVNACRMFIAHPYGMITFWGGSGNAKSMALQSVVNHFVDSNVEAIYITAFDLISYIRAAFSKNKNDLIVKDEDAYSRLVRFGSVKLLAIDEFDKVRVTEWVQEQLTDLIDRRYRLANDSQSGTLLAMNDDPRELPAWMYSRLAQNIIIHNPDKDMRPIFGEMNSPINGGPRQPSMFETPVFSDPRTGERYQ